MTFSERLLDVADRALGVELTLLFEAALAFEEFFAVEIGEGMEDRLARRARIGQEAESDGSATRA